jgi:hypothetical protein
MVSCRSARVAPAIVCFDSSGFGRTTRRPANAERYIHIRFDRIDGGRTEAEP